MKADPIHPWRWRALLVWCIIFTAATAWGFKQQHDNSERNATARTVLCHRQVVLRHRIDRSVQYLQDLHTGKRRPIPGITEADILLSIKDDREEVISLRPLAC